MRNDATRRSLLLSVLLGVMFAASGAQQGSPAGNPRVVTTQGPESFVSRVVTTELGGPGR